MDQSFHFEIKKLLEDLNQLSTKDRLKRFIERANLVLNEFKDGDEEGNSHKMDLFMNTVDLIFLNQINGLQRDVCFPIRSKMEFIRFKKSLSDLSIPNNECVLSWLKRFSLNSILLDIGANIGIYTTLSSAFGYDHILSVEPLASNFELLSKTSRLNNLLSKKNQITALNAACIGETEIKQNPYFIDLIATLGDFSGASHVMRSSSIKDSEIKKNKPKLKSLAFEINTLINLLLERANDNSYCSSERKYYLSDVVIKIDTDDLDFILLNELLHKGIASRVKAIIIELDIENMNEDLRINLLNTLKKNSLHIAKSTNNDILILPNIN